MRYPLEEQPLAQALTARTLVADVVYLRAEDGTLRPFTMTSLPFFDPDSELIGVANYIAGAHDPASAWPSPPERKEDAVVACASVRECRPMVVRDRARSIAIAAPQPLFA